MNIKKDIENPVRDFESKERSHKKLLLFQSGYKKLRRAYISSVKSEGINVGIAREW